MEPQIMATSLVNLSLLGLPAHLVSCWVSNDTFEPQMNGILVYVLESVFVV